jgi:flagellar biosynthesis protein FliQ
MPVRRRGASVPEHDPARRIDGGGRRVASKKGPAMTGPEVLDVARDAIITLVLVSSPLMLVGLVVGVVISLFQALTQIQEMTLVFVPKIIAIFIAMLLALPFMADALHGHVMRLTARIVAG